MLDAKQITGKHSAPYLRNVDVQWGRVNVDDLPEMDFDEDDRVRFSLRAGDLLVCEGGEIGRAAVWQGHIRECYYQKAIHRVRALNSSECSQYLYYCFHAAVSAGVFTGGTGTTTIEHLPAERLRKIRFPFPPAGDQLAIASFLDRETARIDALVARKRRLLELLEEKRLAVITHAVTKGLDPNAPMKDSGIDWLGQIPAHWTLGRISSIQERITYGFTNPMPTEDEGPYMLTANDIDFSRIRYETARHTSQEAYESDITDKSRPRLNDLLLTKDGTLGRVALFDGQSACINQSIALMRLNLSIVEPSFVLFALMSSSYQDMMMFDAGGTTIKHIYITKFAKMPFAYPSRDEQSAIVRVLTTKLAPLNRLLDSVRQSIGLLGEYRSALITSAVTGKIDVRGAAERKEAAE